MASLMLSTGSAEVTRKQVDQVDTPDATKTWHPIPHATLIDHVTDHLTGAGYVIEEEHHALARDGDRYFGLLQIKSTDKDFRLVTGIRNSHDKSFPSGITCGASVMVCDNLSFSGEIRLARRHTTHILRDLPQVVARAVGKLADQRALQGKRFGVYKSSDLTDVEANDLIVRALEARVMPVTKTLEVVKEWQMPRHPEFTERNGWRLFNAFTEVLKGNLNELPRRTMALHGLLDTHFGLLSSPEESMLDVSV